MTDDARTPPHVSELTRPFWEAARRHQLVRPHCGTCDLSFFSPQVACPSCHREDWTWEPSSGRGRVHSHTVVHRAPRAGFDVPYVVADVDVEEGWNLMTNIVGCDPDAVHIGMPVRVAWQVVPAAVLPVFSPEPQEQR